MDVTDLRGTHGAGRTHGPAATPRSGRVLVPLLSTALTLLVWSFSAAPTLAQETAVGGTVVHAESFEPLADVQISIVGTERGTLSNENGTFRIGGVSGPSVSLRFRHIGYRTRTVTVEPGAGSLQIEMEPAAVQLDELVVTGTARESQLREVGNAIASVNMEEVITEQQPLDLQQILPIEVPGFRIRQGGGTVGAGGSMTIRGAGSLALPNAPLVYVDGVRVNNDTNVPTSGFYFLTSPARMNDLNMDEVESVEVIKGPAASTLYGTEASNGVVQIITKKGRSAGEGPRIRVALRGGVSALLNAEDKYPVNYGIDPETGELLQQNLVEDERERGTPIFRRGFPRAFYASVSGGTGQVQYYLSGDISREEGVVPWQWKNAQHGRINLGYVGGEDFEVRGNLGVIRQDTRGAGQEDGNFPGDIMWGSPLKIDSPTRGFFNNVPEDYDDAVEGGEEVDRMIGSLTVNYNPFDWLQQSLTVGGDIGNVKSWTTWPRTATQPGPFAQDNLGRKELTQVRTELATIDYSATIPVDLTSSIRLQNSLGVQYNQEDEVVVQATGIEFPVVGVTTISGASTRMSDEEAIANKTFGLYVQERLGWNNRLFVTAAVRGDDNSAFGENFDFKVYPKASVSWVLSEEPFFDVGFVSSLRLRSAWGMAGQQPDVFAARRLYEPSVGPGGAPTVTTRNIGNPDLKPEVGEELEAGFDASLLDERLSLQATYYDQTRTDAIVQQAALPSMGFPGFQLVNIGEVSNEGFELSAEGDVLQGEDWNWNVGVSYSNTSNEVVEVGSIPPPQLRGLGGAIFTQQRHIEGFPVGSLFLKKVVQAEFDENGDLVNVMCEGGDPITGGGPPVPCDEAGTAYFGQPVPTWDFTARTTLRYDRLQLQAVAGGHGGHVRCNGDIAWAHVFFRNSEAINTNSDPILAAYDQMGVVCQAGLVDNSFLKLRSVSASYQFPPSLAQIVGASRASLNVALENPLTLWMAESEKFGRKVIDPEVTQTNINGLNAYQQKKYPQIQRLIAELRLSF